MSQGASFVDKSCNRKLARVGTTPARYRARIVPMPPYVCSTAVSIEATCPDSCPFKGMPGLPGGCFAEAGIRKKGMSLDQEARNLTTDAVIAEEARLINAAFGGGQIPEDGADGGRDLRLHTGGDVGTELGARLLAQAAEYWRFRGGGSIWTYTHRWREIPREAWGDSISVLASVEKPEDIEVAQVQGYAAAIVVEELPVDGKAFYLPGSKTRIVPCPAETRGTTCAECRLCMRDQSLAGKAAIAFGIHGQQKERARETLLMSQSD